MSVVDDVTMRLRGYFKPRLSIIGAKYAPWELKKNREADLLLIWFPKTGGTWTRLMINTAFQKHSGIEPATPLEFREFPRAGLPLVRPFHEDEPHWKTPEMLSHDKSAYAGQKVLLLVRDPRDAMVSLHFQMSKRWRVTDESLSEWIWRRRGGLRTFVTYYNIWAQNRHVPKDIKLVRYEDTHLDPKGTLRGVLDFAGAPQIPDEVIEEAVEENRIERLRERERSLEYETSRLRPGDLGDPESFKARRGKVGGYVDYIDPGEIAAMNEVIATLDPWYGYE